MTPVVMTTSITFCQKRPPSCSLETKCESTEVVCTNSVVTPSTTKRKQTKKNRKRPKPILLYDEDILLETALDQFVEDIESKNPDNSILSDIADIVTPDNKTYKKGQWTFQEDALLSNALKSLGGIPNKKGAWNDIAMLVPGRCPKQCRERFYNHLDETIATEKMESEEFELFHWLTKSFGPSWAKIAEVINEWRLRVGKSGRRTDNSLKNLYNACIKKKLENHDVKIPDDVMDIVKKLGANYMGVHKRARSQHNQLICNERLELSPNPKSGLHITTGTTAIDDYKAFRSKRKTTIITLNGILSPPTVATLHTKKQKLRSVINQHDIPAKSLEAHFEEAQNDLEGSMLLEFILRD